MGEGVGILSFVDVDVRAAANDSVAFDLSFSSSVDSFASAATAVLTG